MTMGNRHSDASIILQYAGNSRYKIWVTVRNLRGWVRLEIREKWDLQLSGDKMEIESAGKI